MGLAARDGPAHEKGRLLPPEGSRGLRLRRSSSFLRLLNGAAGDKGVG